MSRACERMRQHFQTLNRLPHRMGSIPHSAVIALPAVDVLVFAEGTRFGFPVAETRRASPLHTAQAVPDRTYHLSTLILKS